MTIADFTAIINQLLPEPHAGLLSGILFGTRATLSKQLSDALIKTGTLHIIALSGMNITILAGIIATTLGPFVSRRLASLLTIVLIILFILFVGPSPSVIRAGIMGGISLLAISFGRQYWSLYSLVLAAGVMLLLRPFWIGDLSFQLSVLATLGIILFATKGDTHPQKWTFWQPVESNLRLTLSAQVFTIPLIFAHFHRISLISPLANLLIGFTIAPLTIIGFMVAIGGMIWLPLGQVMAWAAWVFLEYIVRTISLLGRLPMASVGFN